MGPSEVTSAVVKKRTIKVRAHTRKITQNPKAAAGDVAAGQRMAALGRDISEKAYAAKPLKERKQSLVAARAQGPQKRTRAQRVFLDTHAQRMSPAGQGRGALAKRYADPLAGQLLAQTHPDKKDDKKPAKIDNASILKNKLAVDAGQAALLRATLKNAKAPWFNQPAKNAVNFALTQLQRPSTAIGAAVKGRLENPSNLLHKGNDTAVQGFLHPNEHAADWNDAVDAAGIHNKYVKGAVALTASIVTDPTTYIALGTGTLAKEAGSAAAKAALKDGKPLEEALRAGRAAARATGPAGQKRGVTIGVRGHVVRKATGKRVVMSKPLSGPTREFIGKAASKAGAKLGVKRVKVAAAGDVFEGARKLFMNPNVRPRGWEQYEYEVARQAGNTGRAMERTAQRSSDTLKANLAKRTKDWTDDEHLAVHHALEAEDFSGLNPEQRAVAADLKDRADMWYALEPNRPKLGPNAKVGWADAPHPPAIANPVTEDHIKASRASVKKAVKDYKKAEAHEARWSDPSTRLKPGSQSHLKAQRAVVKAREGVRAASQAHTLRLRQVGTQRKAVRNFTKDMQSYNKSPAGYTARRLNPEELTGENAMSRPSGRGPVIGHTTSYKGRKAPEALAHLDPEALGKYDFNVARSFGDRELEHGRILAAQEQHRWMAGMGDPVNLSPADVKAMAGNNTKRLFMRDERGIHPMYNTETGDVKVPELLAAVNAGREVVEVHPDKFATIQDLIKGGQRGGEVDPADLLRPMPGEARENFLKRAQRSWKWWATAPNPSYHARNAVGDMFNGLIAGTTTGDMKRALLMNRADQAMKGVTRSMESPDGKRAIEVLRKAASKIHNYPATGELSDLEVMGLANKYGAINSGIISGELRDLQTTGEGPVVEALHLAPARDAIQKIGDYRENIMRLATFRNGLTQGMTPSEAAAYSLKHHIDYSNLSKTEVSFWRYAVPFWTWWSRNLPLQARSIVGNPGMYANVEKARRQSLITAGVDPNIAESMGDSDQENLPWGTPFKVDSGGKKVPLVAGPGLSYMDLGSIPVPQTDWNTTLKATGSDLVGRVNPFVKTAGEEISGVNPYTLQQHEQHNEGKYVTAPSFMTPGMMPGVKEKYNKKTGKMETQANWRIMSALNTVPVVNRLGKISAPEPVAGKQTPSQAIASWLAGPKFGPVDTRQLKVNQLYDQRAQIDSWITEHKGDYKHEAGARWEGPIGKAYSARSKIQKEIDLIGRSMGFKNTPKPGRPQGTTPKMFGAPSGGGGMFGGGG